MKENKLHLMAKELAKDLKTPEDLSKLTAQLTKVMVETALKTELDDHLGYTAHSPKGYNTGNTRNGYSNKTLQSNQLLKLKHLEIETLLLTLK